MNVVDQRSTAKLSTSIEQHLQEREILYAMIYSITLSDLLQQSMLTAIQGHSLGSAFWPPTIRFWSWNPFLAPQLLTPIDGISLMIDSVVIGVRRVVVVVIAGIVGGVNLVGQGVDFVVASVGRCVVGCPGK